MAQEHLYLVDGSGYIFRAYHRLPPLTNPRGEPVNAVYGFTTMMWKLVDDLHKADGPTHLAVIFDASGKSFRNEIYDQYKAHRPPAPEDLVPQFPLIRDATRAFSLPCIEQMGVEADDIIASYALAAHQRGWKVTIVSSDKDLMQLIQPGIDLYDPMKNVHLGPEAVIEKFGVGPEQLGDVLALMGDSADNVPGVPGIGPKTASKLIAEYGDLDNVLASAPAMKKSKMQENLIAHADMARLSRTLVTLKGDCDLPDAIDDMAIKGIPPEPLRAFLDHQGFRTLLAKVKGGSGDAGLAGTVQNRFSTNGEASAPAVAAAPVVAAHGPESFDHDAYETVVDVDALDRWIAEATALGVVAVDTETDALDSIAARLVGVSLATGPNRACYIPLGHGGGDLLSEVPVQIPMQTAIARLKPLLEDPAVLKIGQNLKYDLNVLARHNIHVAPFDDTMVLSFDLDAGLHGHGMDELSVEHFQYQPIAFKQVCGTGKSQIGFDKVDLRAATRYAAEDADVTLRLWQRLKPRLAREHVTRVYEMVDRPLVAAVAGIERHGVKVDREALSRLSTEFAREIAVLEGEIFALVGEPFTIGSPKHLGEVLFDKMGLKGGRKGKTGVYSTDVTELERLAGQGVEVARKVLDWRQLSKLKSTYTDALLAQINPDSGRVHTSYSLVGAQTGRLSSTEPNLQNIPVRTAIGRQIRTAFIAEPGNVILAADYSQIELRLAAHMADVPELKAAFAAGEDIHAATARELFGEVNRDTRGRAKTINFSILYGISRWGLAGRLETSPEEAQAMIDAYHARFPGISRYMAETIAQAKESGFTTTLFGRKCHFPRLSSANGAERQGSERAAVNAPIQGTSADIIKRAMVRMGPALEAAGLHHVRMLMQVHDELVFELPEGDVEAASAIIRDVMANAAEPLVQLSVPLEVQIGHGPNWDAAH
ncbi:DNA polymerase I [Aquisediminimonas sediminicola]|uniref:DNA polymerase I n=1 Tax=Alteraquisediminimonas sediminicola TaxID=2676787 RepID=UPI001C8DDF39|nr:DNA polymerase I [Aquisediminimonas sediminicola]